MNWERYFWVIGMLCFFLLGCWFGFVLHESLMIKGLVLFAEGLEGTTFNIEVDFNETEITDRVIEYFNESLINNEEKF